MEKHAVVVTCKRERVSWPSRVRVGSNAPSKQSCTKLRGRRSASVERKESMSYSLANSFGSFPGPEFDGDVAERGVEEDEP